MNKYIVKYKIVIKNTSVLMVNNSEDELLIDKKDNKPIIQGTTLAGAFRNYYRLLNDVDEQSLFGDGENTSKIIISDAYGTKLVQEIRPQIKIDYDRGIVDKKNNRGQLNFNRYLAPNNEFNFEVEIQEKEKDKFKKYIQQFKDILFAIENKLIRIGSSKTSGAGTFSIVSVYENKREIKNSNDFFEYLSEIDVKGSDITNDIKQRKEKDKIYNKFSVELNSITPLLIQKNTNYDIDDVDRLSYKAYEEKNIGKYIIPGSSLKGVIRNHCTKLAGYFNCKETINKMFGKYYDDENEQFGIGRMYFKDYIFTEVKDKNITNRIKIDKFTGGIIEGSLLQERPIMGKVNIEIYLKKCQDDEEYYNDKIIGILILCLKDLADGTLSIGGGYSIGRGRFKGEKIYLNDEVIIDYTKNDNSKAIKYIKELS